MAQEISFNIKGIELLDYSITSPDKALAPQNSFRFDMNIEHRFNLENKNIFVVVTINIFVQDQDKKLGSAKISCIYNVTDLENYIDKGRLSFPDNFIITLNSISLSTCRGILFTLFKGTFLHNAILPIIDTKSLEEATNKD